MSVWVLYTIFSSPKIIAFHQFIFGFWEVVNHVKRFYLIRLKSSRSFSASKNEFFLLSFHLFSFYKCSLKWFLKFLTRIEVIPILATQCTSQRHSLQYFKRYFLKNMFFSRTQISRQRINRFYLFIYFMKTYIFV